MQTRKEANRYNTSKAGNPQNGSHSVFGQGFSNNADAPQISNMSHLLGPMKKKERTVEQKTDDKENGGSGSDDASEATETSVDKTEDEVFRIIRQVDRKQVQNERNKVEVFGFEQEEEDDENYYESTFERSQSIFDEVTEILETMLGVLPTMQVIDNVEPLLKKLGYFPASLIENCKQSYDTATQLQACIRIPGICYKMATQILSTQYDLDRLAGLAQETKGSVTGTVTQTGASKSTPSARMAVRQFQQHNRKRRPIVGGLPVLEDGTKESLEGTPLEGRNIRTADEFNMVTCQGLKPEEKSHLLTVANRYGLYLSTAKIADPPTKKKGETLKAKESLKYKENLQKGVQHFRVYMSGESEIDESKQYCPPMVSMEVPGVQPMAKTLFDTVNQHHHTPDSDGSIGSDPFPPSKNAVPSVRIPSGICGNQDNQGQDNQGQDNQGSRIKRTVDFAAYKPGRNKIVMLDSAMRLPIEVKPLFRSGVNPDTLNNQSKNQVIGHLAKYLNENFNFRGIGFSSLGTGVICTLCYVQVIQIYLIIQPADEKGEGMIKRFKMESNYLPLISLEHFEAWEQKHKSKWLKENKKHLDNLKQKMYEDNLDGGISSGIPIGILALHEIMKLPRGRLFGPDIDNKYRKVVGEADLRIEGVLGQGSQGVVLGAEQLKAGKTHSYAIKAPCLGSDTFTRHECNVLQKLGQVRGPSTSPKDFISILEREIVLQVQLGSCTEYVSALLISPKGVPLTHHMLSINDSLDRYNIGKAVWFQGKRILDDVHSKGIVHNDISPKNFIVVETEKTPLKLCLVDLATACPIGYELPCFFGTAAYAHDDILKNYPKGFKAMAEYDKYGLAVTSLAIVVGGQPSWDMSDFKDAEKRKEVQEKRDGVLKKILSGMEKLELKNEIEETDFREDVQKWVSWKTRGKRKRG